MLDQVLQRAPESSGLIILSKFPVGTLKKKKKFLLFFTSSHQNVYQYLSISSIYISLRSYLQPSYW